MDFFLLFFLNKVAFETEECVKLTCVNGERS
jgi:hypothetical protein